MPEQFAFEQCFRNGSHIHTDHLLFPPQGKPVDFACQHFLTRTVFSGNQDIGVCRSHLLGQHPQLLHDRTFTPIHPNFTSFIHMYRTADSFLFGATLSGRKQRIYQLLVIPWLDYKICSSFLNTFHSQVNISVGREEYNRQIGALPFDFMQPVQSFVPGIETGRKVHVEQDNVPLFPT